MQTTNDLLDKKELIKNLYERIADWGGFRDFQEQRVEMVIEMFCRTQNESKCLVCGKPNWEKLADCYGMNYQNEFYGGKCGYCKLPQPKKEYLASWVTGQWKQI